MRNFQNDGESEECKFINLLYSNDKIENCNAIRCIKNQIIGMKFRKAAYVKLGVIERVIDLMMADDTTVEFAIEGAVILGSLARGSDDEIGQVLDSQAVTILCKGICHHDERLVLACLRSLCICYNTNLVPADLIYEDVNIISALVDLLRRSSRSAECAANILLRSCKTMKDQAILYDAGIMRPLIRWLNCDQISVLVPVIGTLSVLVCANETIANSILTDELADISIKEKLLGLMSRNRADEVQLEAAVCLTKVLKASTVKQNCDFEGRTLNVLVRMCHKGKPNFIRVIAGNTLAYLIEDNVHLQEVASITNHLLKNIAFYFKSNAEKSKESSEKLKESGFKVLAAISSNDEKIRKQIVESAPKLVADIHDAINQEANTSLQAAGLQCLLSLSRSVQQLRTTFQNCKLWEPVISALKSSTNDDIISASSSVLCNLLLNFSPCKEALVELGALEVLYALMQRSEAALRVNGIWGLMNLAYYGDDALKYKIIEFVGIDTILGFLSDSNVSVAEKTLGLLRNLLTEREQIIDKRMKVHGVQIMEAVLPFVINDNINEKLKEEVLCLLSNIASGSYAKDLIMAEDMLLAKLICYITSENEKLQAASVFCITNLMRNTDDRTLPRQFKLRDFGAEKQLQLLLATTDTDLFERVKVALQLFTTS